MAYSINVQYFVWLNEKRLEIVVYTWLWWSVIQSKICTVIHKNLIFFSQSLVCGINFKYHDYYFVVRASEWHICIHNKSHVTRRINIKSEVMLVNYCYGYCPSPFLLCSHSEWRFPLHMPSHHLKPNLDLYKITLPPCATAKLSMTASAPAYASAPTKIAFVHRQQWKRMG